METRRALTTWEGRTANIGFVSDISERKQAAEALEAFRADPEAFDLVVTDMTMPNMTGVQLAAELKKIRPNIPIVLCTGFSYQIDDEKRRALGIEGFVMKPIIMKEIAAVIRKAWTAGATSIWNLFGVWVLLFGILASLGRWVSGTSTLLPGKTQDQAADCGDPGGAAKTQCITAGDVDQH